MCAAKTGARPGTLMRGRMAEAYDSRGKHISSLWVQYSSKAAADFVLRSDPEFLHFVHAESDPNVKDVDYAPKKRVASVGGEDIATIVDAVVTLRSGQVVWREIKASPEASTTTENIRQNLQLLVQQKIAGFEGVIHELWTPEQICAQPQRIKNWTRIVKWLAACRYHPIPPYSTKVERFARAKRRITYGEVIALGPPELAALYGAGLFRLLQYGILSSDLDVAPLTNRSQFFIPEDGE